MQVQAENQPFDDINVTPMLDLAYVLLVIFIIMTTASVQGVKVNSPRTSAASSLAKPQTRAITITRDGKAEIFRQGDTCAVPANYPHAEKVGPQGVALIAGRKAV